MLNKDFLLQNRVQLKKICAGIYFLFKNDSVVYIGSSRDCNKRIREHTRRGMIDFDSYYIQPLLYPSIKYYGTASHRMELIYINHFRPKYNKYGNPDYHDGKAPLWFEFISQDLTIAQIANRLNLDYAVTKNIIEGKRKCLDEKYGKVFDYFIEDFSKLKKYKENSRPLSDTLKAS